MVSGYEWVVVLAVVALLFGGAKLPQLARGLGAAKSEFEKGLAEGERSSSDDDPPDPGPVAALSAGPRAAPLTAEVAEAEARAAEAEARAARLRADALRLATHDPS